MEEEEEELKAMVKALCNKLYNKLERDGIRIVNIIRFPFDSKFGHIVVNEMYQCAKERNFSNLEEIEEYKNKFNSEYEKIKKSK